MPYNLLEQILVCIVRLSSKGYSQREVARMLDVSQRCVSKILRWSLNTGPPHQWRCGGAFSIAQKVGPQVLEAMYLQWWILLHAISRWWPCLRAPQARGVTDRYVHLTHVWFGLPSTMVGGVNWWNWMEPSTTKATSGFSVILLCTSLGDGRFGRNFVNVQDNATPHTACDTTVFLAQQYVEVMDWPAWIPDTMNMYGTSLDLRHEWPHFYCARTAACCLRGMGCSSPKWVRTLVESMPCHQRALLDARGGHTRYCWCGDMDVSMFDGIYENGHMLFGFLSWGHNLNVLFFHCGYALTLFIVIFPVAEPIRDWSPTFVLIVEATYIPFIPCRNCHGLCQYYCAVPFADVTFPWQLFF